MLKPAMNYGAMLGIALIAFSLILYLVGLAGNQTAGYLNYLIIGGAIFYAQTHYKNTQLGGYINYGKAFGLGTLMVLFSAIISSFYSYIFLSFIDASIIDVAMEQAYLSMEDRGMSDEEIEQAMEMSSMFMTPGMMSFMAFIMTVIFGMILSAIISIFTKKEDPNQIV